MTDQPPAAAREHLERFIRSFDGATTHGVTRDFFAEHGLSLLSDEALAKLADRHVSYQRFTARLNAENRRIYAARRSAQLAAAE